MDMIRGSARSTKTQSGQSNSQSAAQQTVCRGWTNFCSLNVSYRRGSGIKKLIPKTIGNRKRDCAWGCAWGINTTWEICRSKSTNQERNERLPDLCFSICRFSQVVFIPQAQPHAQSLFLFPIVFGINLIHFFDFFDEKEERCNRKFDRVLCCFDPLSITPFDSAKNTNCFEKCNVFGNGKCELSAFQKVRNRGANFWQGKAQNSSPILRCTFLARRSAKPIANFSATMVTSLPSFSLSLSLYLSLSHRMYLTHNIGSASALPIIKKVILFHDQLGRVTDTAWYQTDKEKHMIYCDLVFFSSRKENQIKCI